MNYEPFTSIENPTLAHFRHFSSLFTPSALYICREPSTNQLLFMQNKPNFLDALMNVTSFYTVEYENIANWTLGENKPNSKPISVKPKMNANAFSQKDYENETAFRPRKSKPKQTQFQTRRRFFCLLHKRLPAIRRMHGRD